MILLVRIRVLPKLLQTCRVFLSFFCQGQKIHQVRYVCPKKTVYLLKEYWLGELNRPSFCRCSKFHGVFGWKKLKNYETKKTQNAKEQLCKASASWGFFSTKKHRVNGRFFCTKGQSGNPMIWNMLQKHVHVYVTSTWTSVSQLSQLEKKSVSHPVMQRCAKPEKKNCPSLQIQNHQQNYATRGMNGESTRKVCRKSNATTALAGPKSHRLSIGTTDWQLST